MPETAAGACSEPFNRLDGTSKRLLLGAGWAVALLLFCVSMYPARSIFTPSHPDYSPNDFPQFYYAGRLALSGQIAQLYHKSAYEPLVQEQLARGEHPTGWYPIIRPAFVALVYAPLALFSYRTALLMATVASLLAMAVLVWKLPGWFSLPGWTRPCLVCFMPFLWSAALGQETILLTLLVAYSFHLASRDREIAAGIALGLCASKPQLIWLLPLALLAARKGKMCWSFLATGGLLALISFAAVGPSGVREWLGVLGEPWTDYRPDWMGNVRGVAQHFGFLAGCTVAAFILVCLAILLYRGSFAQQFSAALLASILFSPHLYLFDYSLLALVAALYARPLVRLLILLPWVYFYKGPYILPWIFLALVWLGSAAAAPMLDRCWNRLAARRQQPLATAVGETVS